MLTNENQNRRSIDVNLRFDWIRRQARLAISAAHFLAVAFLLSCAVVFGALAFFFLYFWVLFAPNTAQ